nr:M protein [Helicobacter pylori]
MSGAHIVENMNTENTNISRTTASTTPPNNEELLKLVRDLADRLKKLEDLKLEDFEPLRKISHLIGSFFSLGKSSNDTQENSKDALKKEEELKKVQEENAKLNRDKNDLAREKDKLTKDKENLTTALSTAKTQAEQTRQKLNELERRHAPYQKLEKLYEVFLEVKDRLNFNFVATTHSAMDLIASVLSDSKYYLESLYNKASQELSDKRSDKGEKLAELFDLLFEYIKDSKFERLKEPSTYDHSCKKLYPEQNTSQKMQRVVLRGYTYDKKIACHTIVDMGS